MREAWEAIFNGYSSTYFSQKKGAGLLFLIATLLGPAQGLAGLAAAAVCVLSAQAIGFNRATIRSGIYSVNGLLVGLAVAYHYPPTPRLAAMLILAGIMTALATAFLQSAFEGVFALPQFSLAFVVVTTILCAASGNPRGLNQAPPSGLFEVALPGPVQDYLCAIAAVFFRHDAASGLLVFLGLLYSSRIATALSIIGFAAGSLSHHFFISNSPLSQVDFMGYNFVVCAIALGGVFAVPSVSSYCIAALGAALCAPFAQLASVALDRLGLEILSLPFLVVSYLFIAALRIRPANAAPELVLFPAATPEENLAVAQSRRLRQKENASAGLRLPFIGAWQVTQGFNGEYTHQEKWRHALDFSLPQDNGGSAVERGQLGGFPAYGLPIASPQAGFVARLVDAIDDNEPGAIETERNWGNFLSIKHDDETYSLLAHLKRGSMRVKPGDRVNAGDILALCGNSGRSPTPHIHYHLQKTPEPGGETVPFLFFAYVKRDGSTTLVEHALPRKGESVENLVPSAAVKSAFSFVTGQGYTFKVATRSGQRRETLVAAMDLYGWRYLESMRDHARLYYHMTPTMLYFNYCSAKPGSLLFAFLLAASKVPLVDIDGLSWKDELPVNAFLSGPARLGAEFLLPFIPGYSAQVTRRFVATSGRLGSVGVESSIAARWPRALTDISARAVFREGLGPLEIGVVSRNRVVELTAVREEF